MLTFSSLRCTLFVLSSCLCTAMVVHADYGNNNPTGVTGEFNGNITTGCSYDPYTGNATRSITDIVVPGAVGAYPLAFTRTLNTRLGASTTISYPFGPAGGWRHSYQWEVESVTHIVVCGNDWSPDHYTVTFPDGRK